MKRYKLFRDLPTFKAGDEFFISEKGNLIADTPEKPKKVLVEDGDFVVPVEVNLMAYSKETLEQFPYILEDLFEEIKEPECFWFINYLTNEVCKDNFEFCDEYGIKNLKSTGNYFETEEEAEKHIEWLKARAVLIEDTKGFQPDWTDSSQIKYKYYIQYDFKDCEFGVWFSSFNKYCEVHFATKEDAKNSIKNHEKEWKIYLKCQD